MSSRGTGPGALPRASGPVQAFVWRDVPLVQRRQPKASTVPTRLRVKLLRRDWGRKARRYRADRNQAGWHRVPGEEKVFLRPLRSEATRGRKKACPRAARGMVLCREHPGQCKLSSGATSLEETRSNSRARVGLTFFARQGALRRGAVILRPSSATSQSGKMPAQPEASMRRRTPPRDRRIRWPARRGAPREGDSLVQRRNAAGR